MTGRLSYPAAQIIWNTKMSPKRHSQQRLSNEQCAINERIIPNNVLSIQNENQEQKTNNQPHPTSNTKNQHPTTNNQSPTTNQHQPTTNTNQQPITNHDQ
jgi:hypothetical protein